MNKFKKIFIIGDDFDDSFAQNILNTFQGMSYKACLYPMNFIMNSSNSIIRILGAAAYRRLPLFERLALFNMQKAIDDFEPDIIISTNASTPVSLIEWIKDNTKSKVVCWYTDSIANMNRQNILGSPFDMIFFKDPYMVRLFKDRLGLNTHLLSEAFNPKWHRPISISPNEFEKYASDLSMVGNMYYYRVLMLEQFHNYNFKIWGPRFPSWLKSNLRSNYQNQFVGKYEKAKIFSNSKININTLHYTELEGVNCRAFEIAGCSGFQLIQQKSHIKDYFEPDKEIATFSSKEELNEKINYYLINNEERLRIAQRGFERASREHTYEARLRYLIAIVDSL